MNFNLKEKYLKYKFKYLKSKNSNLKNKIVGGTQSTNPINAIAYFNGTNIAGAVRFEELDNGNLTNVIVNLVGFEPNTSHGFHVHEYGDLSSGCKSMCAHFNPHNKSHGGRDGDGTNPYNRHVGDLGNLISDSSGNVLIEFTDHMIKLRGNESNIIGRGLIIHADPDDCGKGLDPTSKITGNSGERIGCAVIGLSKPTGCK